MPTYRSALPLIALLASHTVNAAEPSANPGNTLHYQIPPNSLDRVLVDFSLASGVQVVADGALTAKLKSPGVTGRYTPSQALQKLLAGTGVSARTTASGTVTLEKKSAVPAAAPPPAKSYMPQSDAAALPAVTVTGKTAYDAGDPYNRDYRVPNASTATKTDTPIMDTPAAIQVVPKQVLQDQQAYRVQDAVKNVSGVQQRFSTGGVDRFIVRGFDVGEIQYRNGVRLAGLNFDLANVQQVEVLKGPASTLYGRAEPGGLINIVTKRPRSSEAYYSLEQRFGSYDYYRTQVDATGPVTQDGALSYGFDLSYLNAGSFRDSLYTDRVFLAPSLSWRPWESTEFNLTVEHFNEDRPYDSGIPAYGRRVASVPISRQYDQPGIHDNREHTLIDFNWSHSFNEDWTFRNGVVANWLDFDVNEIYSDSVSGDKINRYTWIGQNNSDMQTVYFNLNGKFDTYGVGHNVLLGGEYYSLSVEEPGSRVYPVDAIDIFKPVPAYPAADVRALYTAPPNVRYVNDESWYGLYFQDQMSLWKNRVHILGGGRYDWASLTSGYGDPAVFQADTLRDSRFSPRVGLDFRPVEWLALYGQWVESFGSNNGRSADGLPFKPQEATQYEGGVKTEFFKGRLNASLAYFNLTKNNVVTTDPNNPRFSIPIGEALSQGVEFDVSGKLTDGLSVIATYAYIDTEITKDYSGLQGKRLPYVPLHSGSVWLKYDFQESFLQGLSLGGGVFLADRRFGDATNSFYDPGYARLDLYAAYRHGIGPTNLTAQLNLNNVTDAEYFILRSRANNQPAEPLTVIGSLRLEY